MRNVIAQSMVIDHGTGEISIDGARLPWFIDERGPRVEYVEEYDVSIVSVPFIVENAPVEITTFEQDIEWIREVGRRELAAARFWLDVRVGRISSTSRPLIEWSFTDRVPAAFGVTAKEIGL